VNDSSLGIETNYQADILQSSGVHLCTLSWLCAGTGSNWRGKYGGISILLGRSGTIL
jgi:hypothetical protein